MEMCFLLIIYVIIILFLFYVSRVRELFTTVELPQHKYVIISDERENYKKESATLANPIVIKVNNVHSLAAQRQFHPTPIGILPKQIHSN
jgi:hypothetical protein